MPQTLEESNLTNVYIGLFTLYGNSQGHGVQFCSEVGRMKFGSRGESPNEISKDTLPEVCTGWGRAHHRWLDHVCASRTS
jgi:hypothetical protein